jgi:hypothetical protein
MAGRYPAAALALCDKDQKATCGGGVAMTEANNDPAKANKDPAAYIAEELERRANFEPETAVQLAVEILAILRSHGYMPVPIAELAALQKGIATLLSNAKV